MKIKKSKFNRIAAWVALFATVLVMLFSTVYLVEHADHSCVGGDCPICSVMEQCSNNLKTIGTAIILIAAGWILFAEIKKTENISFFQLVCNSLVSQKVRLNN